MDPPDVEALRRFIEVPYVIEAPAAEMPRARAAAGALGRIQIRLDESKGLAPARYREIIAGIQAQIESEVPKRSVYKIDIFDRSTRSPEKEELRIDRSLRGFAKEVLGSKGPGANGAFSQPYGDPRVSGPRPTGCVVAGFAPDMDVQEMFSGPVGGQHVDLRGIDTATFHKMSMWHELGHCLLGASEARADTFAALMTLRHTAVGGRDLEVQATYREAAESVNPDLTDDHYISASLWEVVRRADALKASERFMKMSIPEIADAAKAIADRYALGAKAMADAMQVRKALVAAGELPVHFLGSGRDKRRGDIREWMEAHSDVPEFRRLIDTMDNLAGEARPMARFVPDLARFKEALGAVAKSGDPTARAMLAALKTGPAMGHGHEPDFADKIPFAFGKGEGASLVAGLIPSDVAPPAPGFR